MINPKKFRSTKPTWLHAKVRLVKHGRKPTRQEAIDALDYILDNGEAPEGWTFHAIDWEHPTSRGTGDENDLIKFRSLVHEMRDELQFAFARQ